jgi:hypothetical protein
MSMKISQFWLRMVANEYDLADLWVEVLAPFAERRIGAYGRYARGAVCVPIRMAAGPERCHQPRPAGFPSRLSLGRGSPR